MRTHAGLLVLAACAHPGLDPIAIDTPAGISDLTLDDGGHLWAIAERDPIASEIVLDAGGKAARVIRHAIDGVPSTVDTEALTYLGDGRFAIGTEGHTFPSAGVLFARLQPDGRLAVSEGLTLTDAQVGLDVRVNNGTEALCGRGTELIVGIESAGTLPDGGRYAPLIRVSAGVPAPAQRLRLTTAHGKLAALTCTIAADGSFELLAIERDFGVMRILRAHAKRGQRDIPAEVALDLWPIAHDDFDGRLNVEGIARLRDGRLVLVSDNQGPGLGGPTWLLLVHR